MRAAFLLISSKNEISIEFLGLTMMLPFKALDEEGSLNDHKKAYCQVPYFQKPSPEVYESVKAELEEALPLLYREMLKSMV